MLHSNLAQLAVRGSLVSHLHIHLDHVIAFDCTLLLPEIEHFQVLCIWIEYNFHLRAPLNCLLMLTLVRVTLIEGISLATGQVESVFFAVGVESGPWGGVRQPVIMHG